MVSAAGTRSFQSQPWCAPLWRQFRKGRADLRNYVLPYLRRKRVDQRLEVIKDAWPIASAGVLRLTTGTLRSDVLQRSGRDGVICAFGSEVWFGRPSRSLAH